MFWKQLAAVSGWYDKLSGGMTIFACIFYRNHPLSVLDKNTIFILVVAVLFVCFIGVAVLHIALVTSLQADTCFELARQFDGLSLADCVWYVDEKPSATGQDIVDHFDAFKPPAEPSLEELLAGPMIP